jgi:hypothetical protein
MVAQLLDKSLGPSRPHASKQNNAHLFALTAATHCASNKTTETPQFSRDENTAYCNQKKTEVLTRNEHSTCNNNVT